MTLNILFRFRDLVAHTLDEHRKIIDANGFCWWGWWKRPSEQSRGDVWQFLAESIQKSGSETIGLFDSGTGEVWTAKVTDVIPPIDPYASSAPAVPAAEKDFVPAYYKESVFSRAWMKLTEITKTPVTDFFAKYAYSDPPPLPKIPKPYLDRLRGKRVVDAVELRSMDTTIWRVALAQHGADSSHFLMPQTRVIEPISADPIRLKGTKILHLTDLHYDVRIGHESQHSWSRPARTPLHDMIASTLGTQKLSEIALIVLSGDFTFRTKREEFEQAFNGVNALLGATGLGPDNVIICPGNHDIAWTKNEDAAYDSKTEFEPNVPPPEATAEYKTFYERLLQHPPNGDFSMGRRYVLPNGQVLEVCALNSSNLETGKKYLSGMGFVGPSAFENVRSALGWSVPSPALRLVVLHHHVVQTENVEQPDEYYHGFGLAIDAQRVLREAGKAGAQLVIHGHRHRAFFWRSNVYELPEHAHDKYSAGSISIIGSGSSGSTAVVDDNNFFTLIDVKTTSLSATMYRSHKNAKFEPMKPWSAPFSLVDGTLVLGDWIPEK